MPQTETQNPSILKRERPYRSAFIYQSDFLGKLPYIMRISKLEKVGAWIATPAGH